MKKVFGYIRVSTAKQGEGVSLIEQKEAISRYAEKYNLEIIQWFEEKETAAKQGRPLFTKMMKLLRDRKAEGVIIHKIDRSARNFRDWIAIDDLLQKAIEVHFAHENLDMNTRGGRLAADIQLAVAVDYIRNLRQEALKGIYGRLKQGIYPFHAPVGYINNGGGKVKTIDPVQGPLVHKAFELYATDNYSLRMLSKEMYRLGLRSLHGRKLNTNRISVILNNTFYMGIMKVKGNTYNGNHEPLVSPALFKKVQLVLRGKSKKKSQLHEFQFRRTLRCGLCGYSLTGEIQKGIIYYRCHTRRCITKGVREKTVEHTLRKLLSSIQLLPEEYNWLQQKSNDLQQNQYSEQQQNIKLLSLQIGQIEQKIERLVDCLIDGNIEKDLFDRRKQSLLVELKERQEQERQIKEHGEGILQRVMQFFELANNLIESYEKGISDERRNLIEIVTSNLSLEGKKLVITMRSPFQEMINRVNYSSSGLDDSTSRNIGCEVDDTSVSIRNPLTREELQDLLHLFIQKAKENALPKLPEVEIQDDS